MTIKADVAPGARAEEEDDAPPSSEPGRKIPTKCKYCNVENDKDAKHCKGCGESMATEAEEEDEPPPSSEEPGSRRDSAHPPPAKRVSKVGPDAAYAELAGVPADASVPVIKGGLSGRINLALHVMSALELSDPERAVGAFDVTFKDAARVPQLEARIKEQDNRTKLELGLKIVDLKIEGYPRDEIVKDVIDDKGGRTVRLRSEYRRMSVAELDEKYKRLQKRAPKRKETPFEPSRKNAEEAARNGGKTDAERVEAAKSDPTVLKLWRQGETTPERLTALATQFVAAQVNNGMHAGGAS